MPQHLLDSPQVGSPFKQMGGEGMSQGMRTYILSYATLFAGPFHDVKHHDAGQFGSPTV